MKVIAVANPKGRVGKTTVTREPSACCALRGYQTLVIDCDPQANLTASWVDPDVYSITLSHVLIEPEPQPGIKLEPRDLDDAIVESPLRDLDLRAANEQGRLAFHGQSKQLADRNHFASLLKNISKLEWVVYAKPPFGGPVQVLKYLARYTHRVAISNQRLIALSQTEVTFRWKDYADGNAVKEMTLDVREFTRRFLLHILPRGFVRIRHYGFLANRCRTERLDSCRTLLAQGPNQAASLEQANITRDQCEADHQSELCPVCREGRMKILNLIVPESIALPGSFRRAGTTDTS